MVSFELTGPRVGRQCGRVCPAQRRPRLRAGDRRTAERSRRGAGRWAMRGTAGSPRNSPGISPGGPLVCVLRPAGRSAGPCETTSSHPHSGPAVNKGVATSRTCRSRWPPASSALCRHSDGSPAPPAGHLRGVRPCSLESFGGDYSRRFQSWWVRAKQRQGQRVPGFVFGRRRAGRPEVRGPGSTGDVAPFGGGERSEVSGGDSSGGVEGQVRWYRLATVRSVLPRRPRESGLGSDQSVARRINFSTPPLNWSVSHQDGQWTLLADQRSSAGDSIGQIALFNLPGPGHLARRPDADRLVGVGLGRVRGVVAQRSSSAVHRRLTDLPGAHTGTGGPAPSVY